ncbi:MBL fold metallo-hydrolase [Actinacidiphila acidipaludis]|uniref:MBL fold metallo-hydrolase n=1 Tax=Actinacidiphila acidipaludis TaxID=2873382 RepID=A0ABS7Q8R6_9ACTN|nr:MBL fold metallo-hydrolase [Streptomyces acidipaludis]MBY8879094.1 MBL fold metallo-hydrolase [Streptomyces acidipaludis]
MADQELVRRELHATVLGGPTTVLDYGGLRIVSDPTFDPPGGQGYLTKTEGPALTAGQLGAVDLVLVSHDEHPDNLDAAGRAFALAAPALVTCPGSASRLGERATGLASWAAATVPRPGGGEVTVTAVPAVHGPEDGERTADGFVNCEVTGFVLSGDGLPTVYISGDNASIATVAEIARRMPRIDAAVLHMGAAHVPAKFQDRPLSLDSVRAAAAAAVLAAPVVLAAHYDGWGHFAEGRDRIATAFDAAGLSSRLRAPEHGTWTSLTA